MDSLFVLPGTYGADLIAGVYEQGGFDALNGLYLNLPATTEQLMHLDKYLADEQPKAVEPAMISGELGAAWQEVFQGTLGEWKTYQLLTGSLDENARMPEDISQVAAAGWGGDHAQIFFRNSTQEYVVVVEWVWDTPADRTEFADAFTQSVSSKTGASAADLVSGFSCYQNSAGIDCVLNAGQSVVWLQAPDESTMLLLLSAYS
jgi:hypothetical protein